ncbi:MAG: PAS domain S-box protein, partial [Verrucomicrobiaceae bacterium]
MRADHQTASIAGVGENANQGQAWSAECPRPQGRRSDADDRPNFSSGPLHGVIDLNAALHEHAIVTILDLQGRLIDANDKFYALSKYSRAELLGRNHRIADSGHHPEVFFSQIRETVTLSGVWRGEIKHRARDGSFYWAATTVLHYFDGPTGSPCLLSIGLDVTEQKCVELRLKEKRGLQRLLAELAPGFTRVPPGQVNAAIEDAQRRIVETLGLDRGMLWRMGEARGDMVAAHLRWNEEGTQPPPAFPSAENLPWVCAGIA